MIEKNRSKICISIILIFVALSMLVSFSFSSVCFCSADNLYSSAKSCAVLETSTKRQLFGINANAKLPMASTTKIMTAITVLEHCKNLDEKFEISAKAVGVPGTSLYLREGDIYSAKDLLYGLMLISGNDCSVALAEHVAGSTSEFVTMMNDLCRKIGAQNSHFANTHGLDADGHYTTAYDLALIASYALENETFREIVTTKNIKITNGKNDENRFLKNKNKLLFTLEGCVGVKTGYTDDAGRCLVSAIEKDGMRLVCVVLNCRPMFEESAQLLKSCSEMYKLYDLTKCYDFNHKINVVDGRATSAEVGTFEKFVYPLSENEYKNLKFVYSCPESVNAPVEKNTEIGNIEIFLGNDLLFSEKIFTIEDIKTKSLLQRMQDFFRKW